MKIAFFTTSTRNSGCRSILFNHANELARRGHDVAVWMEQAEPTFDWAALEVPLGRFCPTRLTSLPQVDLCVFDRIRLAGPLWRARLGRVVHLCQRFEGIDTEQRLATVWARQGLRGVGEWWRLRRQRRAVERAYLLPIAKIVTNYRLGQLMTERFGLPWHLVPCGLPADVFTPPPARPEQPRTALVFGPADVNGEHVPSVLHAMHLLKQRRPDLRLLYVAQNGLRGENCGKGVADEYHANPKPDQLADLYRRADVLLLVPDPTEGSGLPLLEALGTGLPCVATDIPAFRSFAYPDDYAQFIPVGDGEAMTTAVERLLDATEARQRLSRRGLQIAGAYTMKRSFDAMETVLAVIAGTVGARRLAA